MAVMKDPVDYGRGQSRISCKYLSPAAKGLIGCNYYRSLFIPPGNKLEEKIGSILGKRKISQLVNNNQVKPAKRCQPVSQCPCRVGYNKVICQFRCSGKKNPFPGKACLYAKGSSQMALSFMEIFP
jgi:hypothetical protein